MKKLVLGFLMVEIVLNTINAQNYTQFVDPFIGTGGHGHTFPGATLPFGMVQLSPDTRIDGSWDGCSGYHYSDSKIFGFSHTHLSGTGCSDYGDIMLIPLQFKNSFDPQKYASVFNHSDEKSKPGFYSVLLDDEKINVELTSSTRVGYHKYTYTQNSKTASILLDLHHRDELLGYELIKISENKFGGMRKSKSWAENQTLYFVIEFSQPVTRVITPCDEVNEQNDGNGNKKNNKEKDKGNQLNWNQNCNEKKFRFEFNLPESKTIFVKVALSPVDIQGAEKNLVSEIGAKSFDEIKNEAEQIWNNELSKIEVKGSNTDQLKIFYTSLYHCMIAPNVYMDTDGRYRGRDGKIYTAEGFTYYTVFSLWDTFRALHPLLTIIDQQRTKDFIQTFLKQYEQGGRLPVWELSCNETDCMIGYHSVSVLADAAWKGLMTDDQIKLAYDAAIKSATWNHDGIKAIMNHGYISVDDDHESVSKTLEHAYDDWCIYRLGLKAGKSESELMPFIKRAQGYVNVYNGTYHCFRPRVNGGWLTPFDPYEVNNHYTEANAWHYNFFVPHDIPRLIWMMGGKERFLHRLDSMFSVSSDMTGRDQADITGMIGQYAHGNEPSHNYAYLYVYLGMPSRTQERVTEILNTLYKATPDGLPGNEDCGQMSAWYVFSAMGFYPITPGVPYYTWGSPMFDQVTINLENGAKIRLNKDPQNKDGKYINEILFNGVKYAGNGINHQSLMYGPELTFKMQNDPNQHPGWGNTEEIFLDRKYSKSYTPAPFFENNAISFTDKYMIKIESLIDNCTLYYAINPSDSVLNFIPYNGPFEINTTSTIYAKAKNKDGAESYITKAIFIKKPNSWTIDLKSKYNKQYSAGGNEGLIDGIIGTENWRKGFWQGYQSQDFECIIDLKEPKEVSKISLRFLQDSRSWILLPQKVEFYISEDGKSYESLGELMHDIQPQEEKILIKELTKQVNGKTGRYIKLKAINFGKLPSWHQGAGGDAFIFVDEITVD